MQERCPHVLPGGHKDMCRLCARKARAIVGAGKLALATMGACERLGAGIERTAYALDDARVMKVAKHEQSRAANRAEVAFYASRVDLQPWLAQPLAWADDYSWLMAQRAQEVGRHERHELPANVRDSIRDLHSNNIGVIAGRVVVIDYGFEGREADSVHAAIRRGHA